MNTFVINTKMVGIEDFGDINDLNQNMVDLTIGEPSFLTDETIKQSSIDALVNNYTQYPPSLGFESVRQAISEYESVHSNLNYDLDEIMIVNGATEGIAAALAVLLNEGDEVIIPTPAYAAFESLILMNRGVYVPVDTCSDNFILTARTLRTKLTDKSKVLILTSPNNPTGTVYSPTELQEIVNIVKERDIYVVVDATYGHLVYSGVHDLSVLSQIKEKVIVVYSLSKTYAMTGWRLGYVLADRSIMKYLNQWHHCVVTGVSSFTQMAIPDALKLDVSDVIAAYEERVNFVVDKINEMGLEVIKPKGAFYVFVSIEKYGMSSQDFTNLCCQYNLKVIPGHYFGSDKHFRISCCYSMERLESGMNCLERLIKDLES